MIAGASKPRTCARLAAALLLLASLLAGCADMGDSMTVAFADPAKYELYDCKQLEGERKSLDNREAELQGLMAKADTGFAGPVVSELAYRNDYISIRGQKHFADEAWRRNNCRESAPAPVAGPGPADTKAALAKARARSPSPKPVSAKPTSRARSDSAAD
ncbi:hypothetical protein [Bradyrhizobium sp.]|uniref:hypothetical protein n=1 Tax=Bradyrhizobium sp. TaxID=376 RepID=UPI0025B8DEDB|nr:hypothetical protein [Bradyrhizobium sp.]